MGLSKFDGARLAGVLAAASAVLAGCDRNNGWEGSSNAARVCVDRENHRVPEAQCAAPQSGGVSPFLWYYVTRSAMGGYMPGYGGYVGGGSYAPMRGVSYGAAPAGGIARGGFGGTGGGGEGGAGE
jgi:hypothetical protein